MSNAAFLLIALSFAVVASSLLWFRTRKPTTFMSSIDNFQREMAALARDPSEEMTPPRRPTKLKPIVPSREGASLAEKFRSARQLAGDELAERRGARRSRHRAGAKTILPSRGRDDLADRLSSARRRGHGGYDDAGSYDYDSGAGWDDGS